jgi:hypothetical protein
LALFFSLSLYGSYGFEILHGLLSHKNIRIPINNKKFGDPPYPAL